MIKSELIKEMAKKNNVSIATNGECLDAFIKVVEETLEKGEKVQLMGFGNFEVRERAQRNGVNPQTKEKIVIPAKKAPVFVPAKHLKDSVNK